ncbi:hypothetical protein LCGC14_2196550 [marine sediment metagenome]|uniref:Uncharacterized protein n=1 Tax=marine sediment metagenome TaxID=412755 RepID=A0A0F9DI11_9ZZZZ
MIKVVLRAFIESVKYLKDFIDIVPKYMLPICLGYVTIMTYITLKTLGDIGNFAPWEVVYLTTCTSLMFLGISFAYWLVPSIIRFGKTP